MRQQENENFLTFSCFGRKKVAGAITVCASELIRIRRSHQFLLPEQRLSFPQKRESSFLALDPCFRRGDTISICFSRQTFLRI